MIQENTGKGQKNKPADVVILQFVFNEFEIAKKKTNANTPESDIEYVLVKDTTEKNIEKLPKLTINAASATELSARIEIYQKAKKMKVIDGWVGKMGSTIKALLKDANISTATTRMIYIRKKITNGVNLIKIDSVTALYQKQFNVLSCKNKDGLVYILKTAKDDSEVTLIPELAYMLATTKHETAHTFRAIEEYGKGSGRAYGVEITVIDPATKKTYKNKYYGRGYVQLTWGYNYQRIDQKLGNGNYPNRNKTKAIDYNTGFTISDSDKSIYLNPAKALDKENAYIGLVWGMQNGIYTGKKIGAYITKTTIDYYNARRVINGTDKAKQIASYAENLEILLLTSTK